MAKKKYTIRLYRTHDHDLITFVETHQFNIVKAIYSALTAFSNGETFVISIPPMREDGHLNFNRVYTRLLTLDTKQDAAAVQIMDKLKDGSKNNFLKNLLRLYLCNPMSEQFLKDVNDADFFYQRFAIFREGKRQVEAGKLAKTTKRKNTGDQQKKITKKIVSDKENDAPAAIEKEIEVVQDNHVIDEPDYETAMNDINNVGNKEENDDITAMFSAILS